MIRTVFLFAFTLCALLPIAAEAQAQSYYLVFKHPELLDGARFTEDVLTARARTDSSITFGRVTFTQVPGRPLLYRASDEGRIASWHYLYWLDASSFLHKAGSGKRYTYHHADQARVTAPQLTRAQLDAKNEEVNPEIDALVAAATTEAMSTYLAGFRSRPKNGELEQGIRRWWGSTKGSAITRIGWIDPSYEVVRNGLGVPMNKSASAILFIKNQKSGGCAVQWARFGYDHLGGGKYGKEIRRLTRNDIQDLYFDVGNEKLGTARFTAGQDVPVDCKFVN